MNMPGSTYPYGASPYGQPEQPYPVYPDMQQPYATTLAYPVAETYQQPYGYQPPYYNDYGCEPLPPKKRKLSIITIILVLILVITLGIIGYIAFSYFQGQQTYNEISENVTIQGEPSISSFSVDWDALRAINPDVVAWVYVPGTRINYPVCYRAGDDNYYLYHNFNGYSSPQFAAEFGCVTLSGANKPDFTDQVNIISGHNMWDGSMFSDFAAFGNPGVFDAHRTIYLLTPAGNFQLESFALDYILGSSTIPISFATQQEMTDYFQNCVDNSIVVPNPPGANPATLRQVFAFYTCDNANDRYRYFIFCSVKAYLPAGSQVVQGGLMNDDVASAIEGQIAGRTTQ